MKKLTSRSWLYRGVWINSLCVNGNNVYCKVWEAKVGETLPYEREKWNAHNRYAVHMQPVNYYCLLIIIYSLELNIHSSKISCV